MLVVTANRPQGGMGGWPRRDDCRQEWWEGWLQLRRFFAIGFRRSRKPAPVGAFVPGLLEDGTVRRGRRAKPSPEMID